MEPTGRVGLPTFTLPVRRTLADLEPTAGIEPATLTLRKFCSTI